MRNLAHTHIFPDKLFAAVWKFFDANYWPARYKNQTPEYLLQKGVKHCIAMTYSHKPGIAVGLNQFCADYVARINAKYHSERVTGLATVFPGEASATSILSDAFTSLGLKGLKLHSHVMVISPDDSKLDEIYQTCIKYNKPILFHVGREPDSPSHAKESHDIMHWARTETVLKRYSGASYVNSNNDDEGSGMKAGGFKFLVPHLGIGR